MQVDPSLNIFTHTHKHLDYFFAPKTIAVIGASQKEGSVGRILLWNLLRSPFGGTIYPVNIKRKSVLGITAYKSVKDIPENIELAIIATPSETVPDIIKECVDAKIPAAVVISAGFKEIGEKGLALEKQMLVEAKKGNMRIIGPNCLGIMNPILGLNATFASDIAHPGDIAFISQSGALCTAVLDWSLKERVGFSSFVSIGSMSDVKWSDLINYFSNDPNTHSILIYMESIGDPRKFLSAAREAALTKPIILIKAGRTKESAKAAASHTGAMASKDAVFDTALNRVGILRVNEIYTLFSLAEILSKQPRPVAPNMTIITNAGGPGVIATDSLIANGGKLSEVEPETLDKLNSILPAQWSKNNPIDILGDADSFRYKETVKAVLEDPNVDGLLLILTPQYMTNPTEVAKEIVKEVKNKNIPIFASWMGGEHVEEGARILVENGVPTYSYPDDACKAFGHIWKYAYNLKALYETPSYEEDVFEKGILQINHEEVSKIIQNARNEKRTILTEYESKKIIKNYGIPIIDTQIAKTVEEAVDVAKKIGFPVVLKLHSTTITHKKDVQGVKLNLHTEVDVRKAYSDIIESAKKFSSLESIIGVTVQSMFLHDGFEIIFGSSVDSQFGPVILFGAGGEMVEVFADKVLGLPPLNSTLARRIFAQTKIYQALIKGARGRKKADIAQLEQFFVRFSYLVLDHPRIKECDINPLIVEGENIIALDCRVILFDDDVIDDQIPRSAIRPYPSEYIQRWSIDDNSFLIRPIRPEDEPLVVNFYKELSENTVKQRYLQNLHLSQLSSHERLIKICFNDFDREISMVVEKKVINGRREILGMGRLVKSLDNCDATFSMVIKDKWQGLGIGSKLLDVLMEIAKKEGIKTIVASMFLDNTMMLKIFEKAGFSIQKDETKNLLIAQKKID